MVTHSLLWEYNLVHHHSRQSLRKITQTLSQKQEDSAIRENKDEWAACSFDAVE
jgi:hypothetical protein